MSDESLGFEQLLGDDVKPLKFESRVELKAAAPDPVAVRSRREAATAEPVVDNNSLSGEFIEPVDPVAELQFQRTGIQHGVLRNLRLGKYPIDARLDLHHHTVEQARRALFQFVNDCQQHDVRCALITHGMGRDRQPQPGLLKSCVAHWLPQLDAVLAFHSAQKQHGGVGATYVLLRKSDRKRLENLEIHSRRKRL